VAEADARLGDEVWTETPFLVAANDYDLLLMPNAPPSLYERHAQKARLAERFTLDRTNARTAFVAVRRLDADWPFLVVAQAYTAHAVANDCGVVLLPETRRLFIAAGENLLAYDITPDRPRRLWQDEAEFGFWHWRVHDNLVLMAAELGFAAWDTQANNSGRLSSSRRGLIESKTTTSR
jgi:hypothetical protein